MVEAGMPRTQLDLFADTRPAPAGPAPAAGGWPSTTRGEAQLGLYDARGLLLHRARDAFARGCLDEAAHHYAELHARDPADLELAREAGFAATIRQHLAAAASAAPGARPGALLEVADELASARDGASAALRRNLLREAALAAAALAGDATALAGELPGFYLLAAGADEAALASLTRAAATERRARTLYLLADATMVRRGPREARPLYFEALLLDPFDHALRAARCENVRFLPEVAQQEFAIDDEPAAWCAPVGVVTGVLPCPPQLADHLLPEARASLPDSASEHQKSCLLRARRYVQAMVIEASLDFVADEAAVIDARKTMRALAPTLFAAHMQRRLEATTREG
jgi:hypothetical protein